MRTRFMHGMILPEEFAEGTETATWLESKKPPSSGHWTLFVDQGITVHHPRKPGKLYLAA